MTQECSGITSENRLLFRVLLAFDMTLEKEARNILLFFQMTSLFVFKRTLFLFPAPLPDTVKNKIPKHITYVENDSYANCASSPMLNEADLVIGPLNDITREAAHRELPVWLCHDKDADLDAVRLKKYFPTITPFQCNDSLIGVFRAMSLLRLLESDMLIFMPGVVSTSAIELQDFKVEIPPLFLNAPMDILALFDMPLNYLRSLSIETTTYCNLNCSYCPNSTVGRPDELMDEKKLHRIIDSLAEYMPDFNGTISPHFYGEPLTDNRLERFVSYIRCKLPASEICIYTNGILLSENRYVGLMQAGVSKFIISQHTEMPDRELMHILDKIKYELPEIYSVKYVNQYHAPLKLNRGGLVAAPTTYDNAWDRDGCMAFTDMVFDVHGNAVLCCNDYSSKYVFGNIDDNSVKGIWQSPAYNRARWEMLLGFISNPLCQACKNLT